MRVELIYDADCPNVAAARTALIDAFAEVGMPPRWEELERGAARLPAYARTFGSPTILVDGKDVAGTSLDDDGPSCRVYCDHGRLTLAPSVDQLCAALLRANSKARHGGARSIAASLPAIGTALLPKLTCPFCWPAYSAMLGALGLGFIDYTPYLLPATLVFLAIAVGLLAMAAYRAGRWTPLLLGMISSVIVLMGKFVIDSDWVTNGAIASLVIAIFLSTRMRAARSPACDRCVGDESEALVQSQNH